MYHDEFLATEIGQTGTQFDGLGHIGIQMGKDGDKSEMRFYNGFTAQEISDAYGLKKLGTEKLKPIFTRAHLIDMVALKGGMMDAGQEITSADIKAALAKQNIPESDIKPGDAIMFHTGWGSLWMKNNDRFNSGEPGIGLDAAKWVIEKDLALTGADTWAVEVVPNPDKSLAFVGPCRAADQARHPQPREPDLRRADRRQEVPVRLLLHAGSDQGRHGKQRLPDRDNVTSAVGAWADGPPTPLLGLRCRSSRLMSVARTRAQHGTSCCRAALSAVNGSLGKSQLADWQVVLRPLRLE